MPLKTHVDEAPQLNLTSMIDVVFLLIIFFMVGTTFNDEERKIGLKVPEVAYNKSLAPAPQKRVVQVFSDGHIELDGSQVTLSELTARLSAIRTQYADVGVMIRGDGRSAFQRVAEVLNACKQSGISDLGISVKPIEEK